MQKLINQMNELNNKANIEENLFVKNIIVKKDKSDKDIIPYIATVKWIEQLGERLLIS